MPHIRRLKILAALSILVMPIGNAGADEATDKTAILSLIHSTFDKPDAELVINPLNVEQSYAVAGWTQGPMGGRALLRKTGDKWALILCTGDSIRSADALASTGMPADAAQKLATQIAETEKSVDQARLKMLGSFQGTMRMDGQTP